MSNVGDDSKKSEIMDNLYLEFIGDNFDGTMSQIAHIDISDDIHAPRSITEPKAIQNTFQSIRVMER